MKLRKIGELLKTIAIAVIRAELLLRLKVDKYFIHILYTAFLIFLYIWVGIKVETTLAKVEQNKATLNSMKIYHSQISNTLVGLDRITTIDKLLKDKGSALTLPEKPAYIIDK